MLRASYHARKQGSHKINIKREDGNMSNTVGQSSQLKEFPMAKDRGNFFLFFLFLIFIYFWERKTETECKQGRNRRRGRHRIQSRIQALSCQHNAWHGARTHELCNHDLRWSRMLNQLSHPGALPSPFFLKHMGYLQDTVIVCFLNAPRTPRL